MGGFVRIGLVCLFLVSTAGCSLKKTDGAQGAVRKPDSISQARGALLYAKDCASCHGPLQNSTKSRRTKEQITAALDLPEMFFLKAKYLDADLASLALALQPDVDTTPPAAPVAPTLTALGPTSVGVSWQAVTDNEGGQGLDGYHIYRDEVLIQTFPANVLNFTDSAVVASTTYRYAVAAFDKRGNVSANSPNADVTTREAQSGDDTTPPPKPTLRGNLVAGSSTQIELSWDAVVDEDRGSGLKEYLLFRNDNAPEVIAPNITRFIDRNRQVGVTYRYKLRAKDNALNLSDYSNEVSLTTPLPNGEALYTTACISCHYHGDTVQSSRLRRAVLTKEVIAAAIQSVPSMMGLPEIDNLGTDELAAIAYALSNDSDTTAPTAPTTFTATAANPTEVLLVWTPATDTGTSGFRGYRIYVNGTLQTTTQPPDATMATISQLTPDTLYTFVLEAFDGANNRTPLTRTARTLAPPEQPDTTKPNAPPFVLTAKTASRIEITWQAVTDASGISEYIIYRTGRPEVIVPASQLTYVDSNLTADTDYSYYVAARDGATPPNTSNPVTPRSIRTLRLDGPALYTARCLNCHTTHTAMPNSGLLNTTADAITLAIANRPAMQNTSRKLEELSAAEIAAIANALKDVTRPSNVTGLREVRHSHNSIELDWNDATDNSGSVANYLVFVGNSPTAIVVPRSSFNHTGLNAQTNYSYRILAQDSQNNESATAATISVTTDAPPNNPDNTPPSAPRSVAATAVGSTEIRITWAAATDNRGIQGYHVKRNGTIITNPMLGSTTLEFRDTGLTANTNYSYVVVAHDTANLSTAAAAVSARTRSIDGAGLYAAKCQGCHVTHTALPNSGLTGRTRAEIVAAINNPTGTMLTSSRNLTALTTLELDAIVLALADTQRPGTPMSFQATANFDEVNLSWQAPSDNVGVNHYLLYRGALTTTPTRINAPTVNRSDRTGINENTTYQYTLVAVDAAGNESQTPATLNVTTPPRPVDEDVTPPGAAGNVRIANPGPNSLTVRWNAARDNTGGSGMAGYNVFRNGLLKHSGNAATLEFVDSGLSQASSYRYVVESIDRAGLKTRAAAVTGTTTTPNGTTLYNTRCLNCHVSHSAIATSRLKNVSAAAIAAAIRSQPAMAADTTHRLSALSQDEVAAIAKALADSTHQDRNAPSKPTALTGIASDRQVILGWGPITDTGGSGLKYTKIFRGGAEVGITNGRTFTEVALSPATIYKYKVQAFDNFGNASPLSNELTITTLPTSSVPDTQPPTAPTALTGTPSSYSVSLDWRAATDNRGVSRYAIYRNGSRVKEVPGVSLTTTDSPLVADTAYSYAVAAIDFSGNEGVKSALYATRTLPPVGEQIYINRNCYSCHGLPPDQFISGHDSAALFKDAYLRVIDPVQGRGSMQGMPRISTADLNALAAWATTLDSGGGAGNPDEASYQDYQVPVGTRFFLATKLLNWFVDPASTDTVYRARRDFILRQIGSDFTNLGGSCTRNDGTTACPNASLVSSIAPMALLQPQQSAGRSGVLINVCATLLESSSATSHLLGLAGLTATSPFTNANVTNLYQVFYPGMTPDNDVVTSLVDLATEGTTQQFGALARWQTLALPLCEHSLAGGF